METATERKVSHELGATLVREIEAAIKRFNMYPPDHPATRAAAEIPYETLKKIFAEGSAVVIGLMENKLAINGHVVEGLAGKIVLAEALAALNLHSLSFSVEITLDDFRKLLDYFIGKMGGRITWNSLELYIGEQQISGVGIDELRYELVGRDQTVVDSDVAAMGGSGGAGHNMAEVFADHPELILGLLSDKDSAKSGIPVKYAHAIDFNKVGDDIKEELNGLSDEQMMAIITAGLKDNIKNAGDYDEVDMQETLYKINEMLEKRDRASLIPRIQKLAQDLHLIDDRFLDMILNENYSRKKLAFEELETAREALEHGAIMPEKYTLIAKRLEIYDDQAYTEDFIKSLLDKIDADDESWSDAAEGFDQVLEGAVKSGSTDCLLELYRQILDKISDYNTAEERFGYYMSKAETLVEWLRLEENLPKLRDLFDVISVYTSRELMTSVDKRQAALDFYEHVGSNEFTGALMKLLEKKFEALNRLIFDILKHIQTQAVALKLCEYLNYSERSVRLFNIRLLSEFKHYAPRAFRLIISDSRLKDRPAGQDLLANEKWFKLRNIILISGNIASEESIQILEELVSDPDPRVAEEMILALEKIKSENTCAMLSSYLYFNDSKIRSRAAVALGNVGNAAYLGKLIDAFGQETEVKAQMIPIIARLGQEKSLPFFRNLLMNQKDSAWKSFLGRSSDDFKMQIISALSKIPSPQTIGLLDEFKSSFGKGFGALFKSNKVLVALEETKRSLKARLEHNSVN